MPQFEMLTAGAVAVESTDPETGAELGAVVTWRDLDYFQRAYLEAAYWTETSPNATMHELDVMRAKGEELSEGSIPSDASFDDLAGPSLQKAMADCIAFQTVAADLLAIAYNAGEYDSEKAGHDFWLTRNGHGTGFWDRESLKGIEAAPNLAQDLADWAEKFGEVYVEWGDDRRVHFSGGATIDIPRGGEPAAQVRLPMTAKEAYEVASQWGSLIKAGDPGAVFYSFPLNDARPTSESHRAQCLAYARDCLEKAESGDRDDLTRLIQFFETSPLVGGPEDDSDLAAASEGFECGACCRPEIECSRDPCADVLDARGEGLEPSPLASPNLVEVARARALPDRDLSRVIGYARSRLEDIEEDFEADGRNWSPQERARLEDGRRIFADIEAARPGDVAQEAADIFTANDWREAANALFDAMPAPSSRKASGPWDRVRKMLMATRVARPGDVDYVGPVAQDDDDGDTVGQCKLYPIGNKWGVVATGDLTMFNTGETFTKRADALEYANLLNKVGLTVGRMFATLGHQLAGPFWKPDHVPAVINDDMERRLTVAAIAYADALVRSQGESE